MKMLSFKQTVNLIKNIGDKRTVIVQGENGIGKTALFYHLAKDPQFANHIHVDPIDCTQLSDGSVWMPDIDREQGISRELPNERFGMNRNNQKGINGARPVLVFLDEIAKSRQYIKDVLAPIVYERRIGNYHMPEGSVVFCATNLAVEGLGDSIQAHLRNRLVFVNMRKPNKDEWVNWGSEKGIAPEVLAFAEEYPKLFHSFLDYEAGGELSGKDIEKDNSFIFNPRISQQAYATPRSLQAVSDIVNIKDSLDDDTLQATLEGTIGAPTADALGAYIRFGRENPDFNTVIASPDKAPVASSPVAQIVMAFKLVTNTESREHAEAVTSYVSRMRAEMQSLFCHTIANSVSKINYFVTVTPFQKMLNENKIYFTTK
jgi:MoxR-like ATPase